MARDWCILRTAPRQTIDLARSLSEAGYETWTPVEAVKVERRGKIVEEPRALIPSFVFADAAALAELVALSRSPSLLYQVWDSDQRRMVTKGVPQFTPFKTESGFGMIDDRDLAHLRLIERRRKPRGQIRLYAVGDRVKLTEGAYEGLAGIVTAVRGKKAEVSIAGFLHSSWICMSLLLDDNPGIPVSNLPSEQAHVARAA